VALLNTVYSIYDCICKEEGCFKVETIGDGFMARGAPTPLAACPLPARPPARQPLLPRRLPAFCMLLNLLSHHPPNTPASPRARRPWAARRTHASPKCAPPLVRRSPRRAAPTLLPAATPAPSTSNARPLTAAAALPLSCRSPLPCSPPSAAPPSARRGWRCA